MKYQSKKLYVADIVRVGRDYETKLSRGIFQVKDNEYVHLVTGQKMIHAGDANFGEVGCQNFINLTKLLNVAKLLSKEEVFDLEQKLNQKCEVFEF